VPARWCCERRGTGPAGYAPERWLTKVRRDLTLAGFDARVTFNDRKTVNTSWIRVATLLKQAGLSGHLAQNLSIKLEVDTRPPTGAELVRTVIVRHLTFALCHYSLPSLMAGKVHALITRPYSKGRDWFDLLWYRAHRPPIRPKLDHLQNALDQTQGVGRCNAAQWPDLLREKLTELDIDQLAQDVRPFLERPADRALLTAESLAIVLQDAG
jgi:hypothetical protein